MSNNSSIHPVRAVDRRRRLTAARAFIGGLWLSALWLMPGVLPCLAQEDHIYDDNGKRNPFIALVTPDGRILNLEQESDSELRLEGIIYDEKGGSYAIINQSIVASGDWIADYQVVGIEKNKVIFLKKSGERLELELKKEE